MNLGGRVKEARERRGLTQEELAFGVTGSHDKRGQAMISALETRDSVRSKYAPAIATTLSVDLHWLTTGKGVSGLDEPMVETEQDRDRDRLIEIWGQLSPDGRTKVLDHAKYIHTQEHPADRQARDKSPRGRASEASRRSG